MEEFAHSKEHIGSYLIRTLYQSRTKILTSMLLEVTGLHQRLITSYPFASIEGEKIYAR